MPVLVNCPSCNGPLRVADDLIGRKVRCPSCQTVFEAAEPPPPPRNEEPARIDSWKHLDLEMARDRDPAPPPPRPAPPPPPRPVPPPRQEIPPMPPVRGLVGAIEVDAGPQESPRRPSAPPPDRDEPKRGGDDLRPCPACQKMIHRDSTRCYNCGERLGGGGRPGPSGDRRDEGRDFGRSVRRSRHDDDFDRPRRDSEPHRGTTILVLGIVSLVCLTATCFLFPSILGAILGVIGWWMGQADLNKMKNGSMDPEGQGVTQAGWICSIIGTVLNVLCVLACGGYFGMLWWFDQQQANQPRPGGFQQQPVQRKVLDDRKK